MRCLRVTTLTRMIAGGLSTEECERIRAHLSACSKCSALHDELVETASRLRVDPTTFHSADDIKKIMTVIDVGKAHAISNPPVRHRFVWGLVAAAATVLVTLSLFLIPSEHSSSPPPAELGFRARSDRTPPPTQRVSLTVFERQAGNYRPVLDTISTEAVLAFKYTDYSAQPFPFLMILAVNESGESFWYYPPYLKAGRNPASIATMGQRGDFQLPEEVAHEFAEGRIRLFGIFSRQPLTVQGVERAVKKGMIRHRNLERLVQLDLPGTAQYSRELKVKAKH